SAVYRTEWRARVQVQRSHLVPGLLRHPERTGRLLGEALPGRDEKAQQCGWLKDKYGVSWQVIPKVLPDLIKDPKSVNSQRAMAALLRMKKIDIEELKRAHAG